MTRGKPKAPASIRSAWPYDGSFRSGEHPSAARASGAHAVPQRTGSSASFLAASLASRVTERHAALDRLNHFELLEIPETADRDAIRRAFQQSARYYYPERLQGEYEHLRPLAAKIFCRIIDAYRALEDDASRKRYLARLRGERKAERSGQPEFDAPKGFHAARISMKQGRLEDARLLMRRVCDADPEQPQYEALHAWLRAQLGELRPGDEADAILNTLDRALRQRGSDLEIRMYRARVLQRLGRHEEALRDFSFIANADPRNLEAVQQMRLSQLRAHSGAGTSDMSSKPPSRKR